MTARQEYPQRYAIHCDGHSIRFEDLPDGKSVRAVLTDYQTGATFFDHAEVDQDNDAPTIKALREAVEARMRAHRAKLAVTV